MNKSELITAVAESTGTGFTEARRHVDAVFDTIIKSVTSGEKVLVTGFGTFERQSRPARTVRNPRTGQPLQLDASYAPRFSVGQTFKNSVSANGSAPAAAPAAPAKAKKAAAAVVVDEPKKTVATAKGADKKAKGDKKAKSKAGKAAKNAKAPSAKKSGKGGRSK